ncbi:zinc finger MYM-type protein 1-like, partial [Aphis craccivora]
EQDDNYFENENNMMTDCDNFTQPSAISHFIRPSRTDSVVVKNQFFDKHPIQPYIQSGKGKLDFKRIYKDMKNSKTHEESILTAIRFKLNNDIENVINRDVMTKRALEVESRRKVLESKKNKSKKGHGSLITFLSKHFINDNIIVPIGQAIQNIIVKDIKECQKFSIMIDSTQDVSVMDQLAICVRHVLNFIMSESTAHFTLAEDLFGLVESSSVFLSDSHKRMSNWTAITKVKHVAHN